MASVESFPFNETALRVLGVPAGDRDRGRGVLIGFLDWGFDLLHPCLRDAGGHRTRFVDLWDQSRGDATTSLDRDHIDLLIARAIAEGSRAPIDGVYDPHAGYFTRQGVAGGAHATIIATVAAGTAYDGFRSVAPGADLAAVQLAMREPDWREEDERGVPTWSAWDPRSEPVWRGWRSYDESTAIIAGLEHLHAVAARHGYEALVVNLSLGAWAGAHDGASPVERKIAELVERGSGGRGPVCLVALAAGNAGCDDGHFTSVVEPGSPASLEWRMAAADPTQNKLEIWYEGRDPLEVAISLAPAAAGVRTSEPPLTVPIAPGPTVAVLSGDTLVGAADHAAPARDGLSRVRILLHPPYFPAALRDGRGREIAWSVSVGSRADRAPTRLHAWLERDDGGDARSTLFPSHPSDTLSCLANARGAIAVAGFDHRDAEAGRGLFPASSLGGRPWSPSAGVAAPLVAAPGSGIWGARSKSNGFTTTSGTSPACAFVSGILAVHLQRAIDAGRRIDPRTIADALLRSVRPVGEGARGRRGSAWCPRHGYGAVSMATAREAQP